MESVLTIAGSDSLAGGGIQADLKTFEELDVFGVSALTSIVTILPDDVQLHPLSSPVITDQLDSIIDQLPIHYAKIGLLGDLANILTVSQRLRASNITLVTDPVMSFKEGKTSFESQYVSAVKKRLLPISYVATPNIAEAKLLSGLTDISTRNQVRQSAKLIQQLGCPNVVIKCGTKLSDVVAYDYLLCGNIEYWFENPRLDAVTTNGAGCTFSSAITARLATNHTLPSAVEFASRFVHAGIKYGIVTTPHTGSVWQGAYRKWGLGDEAHDA